MKLSLVLVAYRSAGYLPAAIDSFRRECRHAGYSSEVVVVDHSEEKQEPPRVTACQPDRLLPRPNRGFAAGINAGVAEASGELLLVGNPDIEFHEGALAPLVAALQNGWDVVGPQFVLGDFLLPPSDLQTPRAELARLAAGRWPRLGHRVLTAQARRWCASWEGRETMPNSALSGALLAYSAETARRVGPWDEEYFLYFEETDWLRRARRAGLRLGLEPRARVSHHWGHAADPAAYHAVFLRSRRRYYQRNHGVLGRWVGGRQMLSRGREVAPLTAAALAAVPAGCWWLLAFTPEGLPAAGTRQTGPNLAPAVRRFLTLQPACPDPYLIAFDARRGLLVGLWRWADGSLLD